MSSSQDYDGKDKKERSDNKDDVYRVNEHDSDRNYRAEVNSNRDNKYNRTESSFSELRRDDRDYYSYDKRDKDKYDQYKDEKSRGRYDEQYDSRIKENREENSNSRDRRDDYYGSRDRREDYYDSRSRDKREPIYDSRKDRREDDKYDRDSRRRNDNYRDDRNSRNDSFRSKDNYKRDDYYQDEGNRDKISSRIDLYDGKIRDKSSQGSDSQRSILKENTLGDSQVPLMKRVKKPVVRTPASPLTGFKLLYSQRTEPFGIKVYLEYATDYAKKDDKINAKNACIEGIRFGHNAIIIKDEKDLDDDTITEIVVKDPTRDAIATYIISMLYILIDLIKTKNFLFEFYDELRFAFQDGLDTAKRVHPKEIDLPILKGYWSYYNKDFRAANEYFTKALNIRKDNVLVYYGMGLNSIALKNYPNSLSCFLKVMTLQSRFGYEVKFQPIDVRLKVAMCYFYLRRNDKGLFALKGIITQSPDNVDMKATYGMFLLNEFKAAPQLPVQLPNGSIINPIEEIISICTEPLENNPNHQLLNLIFAEIYFYTREYNKSYDHARISYYNHKDSSNEDALAAASTILGKLEYIMGNYQNASTNFSIALHHSPNYHLASVGIILTLTAQGDLAKAKRIAEKLLESQFNLFITSKFINDYQLCMLYLYVVSELRNNPIKEENDDSIGTTIHGRIRDHVLAGMPDIKVNPDTRLLDNGFDVFTSLGKAYSKGKVNQGIAINLLRANEFYSDTFKDNQEQSIAMSKNCNNAAVAYSQLGKTGKAFDQFKDALKYIRSLGTDEAKSLWLTYNYNSALNYEKMNRINCAKEIYKLIIENHPTYYWAVLRLGLIAQKRKEYFKAKGYFAQVAQGCKNSDKQELKKLASDAYMLLGRLFHKLKIFDQALVQFKNILDYINPNEIDAHCAIGYTKFVQGRNENDMGKKKILFLEATKNFRKACHLNPNNPFPIAGIGAILIEKRRFKPALKTFNVIKKHIKSVQMIRNHALVYFRNQMYEESLKAYDIVNKKSPFKDYRILQCIARVQYNLGNKNRDDKIMLKCIESLREAIKSFKHEIVLCYDLGLALQSYCQIISEIPAKDSKPLFVNRALEYITESETVFNELLDHFKDGKQTIYNPKDCASRKKFANSIRIKLQNLKEEVDKVYVNPLSKFEHLKGKKLPDFILKEQEKRKKEAEEETKKRKENTNNVVQRPSHYGAQKVNSNSLPRIFQGMIIHPSISNLQFTTVPSQEISRQSSSNSQPIPVPTQEENSQPSSSNVQNGETNKSLSEEQVPTESEYDPTKTSSISKDEDNKSVLGKRSRDPSPEKQDNKKVAKEETSLDPKESTNEEAQLSTEQQNDELSASKKICKEDEDENKMD